MVLHLCADLFVFCLKKTCSGRCCSLLPHGSGQYLPRFPDDVGNAVIEYLKNGRPPVESPYVFVKHVPLFEPLKTVFLILDKYVRHAGIDLRQGKNSVAYSPRHSLASRLLYNDVPVETIAAILGHSDPNQT